MADPGRKAGCRRLVRPRRLTTAALAAPERTAHRNALAGAAPAPAIGRSGAKGTDRRGHIRGHRDDGSRRGAERTRGRGGGSHAQGGRGHRREGEGYTVRLKLAEPKVEPGGVGREPTGELVRCPKPEPDALVADCVEAAAEGMMAQRISPAMQARARI